MDKVCEFCKSLRPVVYCKSDAAHLCLSCDAKIHSANSLSSRHSRTLLCESCRYRRAYVRCSTHQIFMCRACDRIQHDVLSQHEKREIRSYIGCPAAKDLAVLWGFELDEYALHDQFGSTESEVGFGSHKTKAFYEGKRQESPSLILQQILDLRGLELSEGVKNMSLIRHEEETEISPSKYNTAWKCEKNLDQHLQRSLGIGSDLQHIENSNQEMNIESFPLQFELLDQMNSSSTVGNSLQGDSFWQCKSPAQSGQLWSQNMQDLGVCEEVDYFDDMSIPDVDLTFRNFEEIFGGEQDPAVTTPLNDYKDASCSSVDKDTYVDESFNLYESPLKLQNFPCSIQSSYSTLLFSNSRLGGESSGTGYKETKHCNSPNAAGEQRESNINIRTKYKEKKVRRHEKQAQYASRKARADEVGKRPISENKRL